MTAIGPPWSEITAYDLNTGEIKWRIPDGGVTAPADAKIPANTGAHMPRGGPLATAGGLLFVATASDRTVRAYDRETGKIVWSKDNRTAGFRLCGEDTKGIRIECRVGGSDLNPYLAMAALLAAGIEGIKNGMELEPAFVGDAYGGKGVREIPRTLRHATELLRNSAMLREAFGDDVIDHYVRAAEWEQEEYDRRITDWEVARGFERA